MPAAVRAYSNVLSQKVVAPLPMAHHR